jgi:GxxExxY protein
MGKFVRLRRKDLVYPELSYKLIGILFEIWNDLGYGYQERYYQKAIANVFKNLGIKFKEQAPIRIKHKGQNIGIYFLDFLVEDKIILEIKKGEYFSKNNINQVYSYLKATNLKLGIIANFTSKGLKFRRIVNLQ